ncbi:AraC family transcriptional regulator [Shewanella sp. D64]|uniref:helix-turn-helix transcriptional regulator n=1 Tax=unclassified Shewanella TaxID=196818 RepID=UPI0022BA5D8E|nr:MULTISPECIES: AraC family transcriptional regulator [unclassified Shewanella]MEC4728766.1 AraC family transcriptional regulator [Shewanella sp. D64]MEC4740208.1 AraC family transcriptional regulator [Shewanella sp. E94]WBJ96262.1 AraC family transcriptional regulator [Shewanella sp. MTB7]
MTTPPNIPNVIYRQHHNNIEYLCLEVLWRRGQQYSPPPTDLHRVSFHCLYRAKCYGTHYIDFESYDYKPGDMVYIAPGQIHAYDSKSKLQGELLVFTDDYYQEIKALIPDNCLQLCKQRPVWQPDLTLSTVIDNTIALIALQQNLPLPAISNQLILSNLLISISQAHKLAGGEPRLQIKYQKLLELIQSHMCTTRHAKDYAQYMAMSYSKLNSVCLKVSGYTLKKTIDNQIVLEAKRLLVTSPLNINQLSERLGFDETTNFIKFFNRYLGITPKKFRDKGAQVLPFSVQL